MTNQAPLAQDSESLLPPLPFFVIDGEMRHEDQSLSLRDFSGTVGEIPVSGNLDADLSRDTPLIKGALRSESLDFKAMQDVIAALPIPAGEELEDEGFIPPLPLPFDALSRFDLDLAIDLVEIVNAPAPINAVSTQAKLQNQRLALNPLQASLLGGTIEGESALNGNSNPPTADLRVNFDRLDIGPFFADTRFADEMAGKLAGHISLLGAGRTLDEVLSTSDGEAVITINDGAISGLILEGIGIDVIEALALFVGEDEGIPIDCGRIDIVVTTGLARITKLVIETEDSTIVGGGTIDLGKETLDIGIEAREKDFSLIDATVPILIGGTFSEPSFSLGEISSLPFFEMGDAEPIDCDALMQSDIQRPQQE